MSVSTLNSLMQEMLETLVKKVVRNSNFDYTRDLYDIDALIPGGVLSTVFDNFQKVRSRLNPNERRCVLNRMVDIYLETKVVTTNTELENIIVNCRNGAGPSKTKRSLSEAFDEVKSPETKFKKFKDKNVKELIDDNPDCVICLESLRNGDDVCMLDPCRHLLHCSCSRKMIYDDCPICKTEIIERNLIKPEFLQFGKRKKLGLKEINKLISSVKNIK